MGNARSGTAEERHDADGKPKPGKSRLPSSTRVSTAGYGRAPRKPLWVRRSDQIEWLPKSRSPQTKSRGFAQIEVPSDQIEGLAVRDGRDGWQGWRHVAAEEKRRADDRNRRHGHRESGKHRRDLRGGARGRRERRAEGECVCTPQSSDSNVPPESSVISHQSSITNHQSSVINHQSSVIRHPTVKCGV